MTNATCAALGERLQPQWRTLSSNPGCCVTMLRDAESVSINVLFASSTLLLKKSFFYDNVCDVHVYADARPVRQRVVETGARAVAAYDHDTASSQRRACYEVTVRRSHFSTRCGVFN